MDRLRSRISATGLGLLAGALLALLAAIELPGLVWQEEPVLLKRDAHSVSIVRQSTKEIYATARWISRVRLGPTNDVVLVVQEDPDESHTYEAAVVDTTGAKRLDFSTESIVDAQWCCDGRIALHLGRLREGLEASGAAVLDVESGSIERLDVVPTFDLAWSEHHRRLFIKTYRESQFQIVEYDPESGSIAPTHYRGVHFSPDGEYYLDWTSESPEPRLYQAGSGAELTSEVLQSSGFESARIEGWHTGGDHALIVRELPPRQQFAPLSESVGRQQLPRETPDRSHAIVDVESGRRLLEFSGRIHVRDRLGSDGVLSVATADSSSVRALTLR